MDNQDVIFIQADWLAEPVRPDNLDSGRKKHLINRFVLANGGGLLMFLDADDWVDRRLVETARAMIGPDHLGGLIETGFATDIRSLVVAPIPNPAFAGEFHRLCGSSTIARLTPGHTDLLRRDPFRVMHEHYRWIEVAGEQGAALAHLPVAGNYTDFR